MTQFYAEDFLKTSYASASAEAVPSENNHVDNLEISIEDPLVQNNQQQSADSDQLLQNNNFDTENIDSERAPTNVSQFLLCR